MPAKTVHIDWPTSRGKERNSEFSVYILTQVNINYSPDFFDLCFFLNNGSE